MALSDNPLLITEGISRFDLIRPEHIEPAVSKVLSDAEKRLEELESNIIPTWTGLIKPLEEMGTPFEYAWGPIGHLLNVKNSPELRTEHEKMLPKVVQFSLRAGQSKPIYDGLIAIRDGAQWEKLDDAQRRVITLKIRDAELAGVGLSGEAKERFNKISTELSQLGNDFMNHVLDSTKAYEFIITEKKDVEGWPQTLLQLTSQSYNNSKKTDTSTPKKGPWRVTLEAPVITPFLKHSKRTEQR